MAPKIPTTMKAAQFSHTKNGLEKNLRLTTSAPLPPNAHSLRTDQVLVRVLSMALNPVDYVFPEIPLLGRLMTGKDSTPGIDYAGRVVAMGATSGKVSSEDLRPEQLVFGRMDPPNKFGTLAEYAVVPRGGCVPLPEGVTLDHGASIGTAALTAYQSIVPFVKAGDRIFINGGSGGTGSFGIQIAKTVGCHVVTSCSGANVDFCKSLGADEVIDYKSRDVVADLIRMGGFSLVVDNVGNLKELYSRAQDFTKEGANFIQVGVSLSVKAVYEFLSRMLWPAFLGGIKRPYQFLSLVNKYEELRQLGEWAAQGKVRPIVDEIFGIEDGGPVRAFMKLKSKRAKGKILIKVAES